jgi:hypothetical protein
MGTNVSLISLRFFSSPLNVQLVEYSTALTLGDKNVCWGHSFWLQIHEPIGVLLMLLCTACEMLFYKK